MTARRLQHTTEPRDPAMQQASEVLQAMLATLRAAPAELPDGVPDRAAAEARLASGVPALTGEPLIDGSGLLTNARAIGAALRGMEEYDSADAVVRALDRAAPTIDLDLLATGALAGTWDEITDLAPRLDIDPHALTTVLDWAARPALRAGAAAVRSLLTAAAWSRGHCPACGASPTLSVIRGKENERWLHCGRCGTGWAFPRVRCPSCGERNHHRLGVLHGPGEGEYRRVEVCESCRGYVKSVAALEAPDADTVLELDLETAGLDFVAVERGYGRA